MSDYHDENEAAERMASQAMRLPPVWNRHQRPRTDWVRLILRVLVWLTVLLVVFGWWSHR